MKPTVSRKKIRGTFEAAIIQALSNLEISSPSKKTKKIISTTTKKLSIKLKPILAKQLKKSAKKVKGLNGKSSEHAESLSQLIQVN